MLLLRETKRIITFIAIFIAIFAASIASAESIPIWNGNKQIGNISSRINNGLLEAAIDETISATGITPQYKGIVIYAEFNGTKAEFWNDADIARSAGRLFSLKKPVSYANGHWWCNAEVLLNALNYLFLSCGKPAAFAWNSGTLQRPPAMPDAPLTEIYPSAPQAYEISYDISVRKDNQTSEEQSSVTQKKTEEDAEYHALPLPTDVFSGKKRPIVVVDPGHGGHDPGAMANNLREKDINLKAGLMLADILRTYGADVKLSRKTDVYLKLGERTQFANKNNADIFVSLHCNAMPKNRTEVRGIEYYIMASPSDKDALRLAIAENKEVASGVDNVEQAKQSDRKTRLLLQILGDMQQNDKISESTVLAENLHKSTKSYALPFRKVAQAPFFVLRGAGMPAVLVEMGYLTNAAEAAKLNSAAYRNIICHSIAKGIVEYIKNNPSTD